MKRKNFLYVFLGYFALLSGAFVSCSEPHFLTDKSYRLQVEADFEQKKAALPHGNLFAIIDDKHLTLTEREALTFLYAYMPTADITDYTGSFHLMNIQAAFRARKEMTWGEKVPESEFRHFVLPVRVNNEPLDSARIAFYPELKPLVKGLSMKDAILEVNHWCHSKAIYAPSDARTSSPLATVRTAYGRCGEESTFLVAALRSIGIPARQVYTPRWAHTDDNHAWVEAWADGNWHFLGACEPEPVLNLGWFNAPASRSMLMHTKVFGRYDGPEEVMSSTPNYTEINVIDNYAPIAQATVQVVDTDGNPVSGALVEYKLYNYAEFYTVARKQSDAQGRSNLTAGRGDLLIWASHEERFGFSKLSFGKQDSVIVTLNHQPGDIISADFDLVPPSENTRLPEVTAEQRKENDRRMASEDSLRNEYVATMMNMEEALQWIKIAYGSALQPQSLREELARLLVKSRGNHSTLTTFLATHRSNDGSISHTERKAISLLRTLSDKDLRDVRFEVLDDHLLNTPESNAADAHLLCPRIATEELTPYKAYFQEQLTANDQENFRSDPQQWVEWCQSHITVTDSINSQRIPMTPAGVWKARVSDSRSRDIFFVAVMRAIGIPAWIDSVTGDVYYEAADSRIDRKFTYKVDFNAKQLEEIIPMQGVVRAGYQPTRIVDNPKYYTHFTLSRLGKGSPQLLEYAENATWKSLMKQGNRVETGSYLLTTGMRLANGGVLAHLHTFNVAHEQVSNTRLILRQSDTAVQVIGNFNSESLYRPFSPGNATSASNDKKECSLLQTCGRGYFVVGILGVDQEPTNHALRDIAALRTELEKWGRPLVLLFPNETDAQDYAANFDKHQAEGFPTLPATVNYGIDTHHIAKQIAESMKLPHTDTYPIFILADTFNRVVFISQGYTIGLGEQIMQTIKGL